MKKLKRAKQCLSIFIVSSVLLSGCTKKDLPDSYMAGSDFQYMYLNTIDGNEQQKIEEGNYFRIGHYLYFLDQETKKLVPLCNKADCLHDKETDEEQFSKCNAYFKGNDEFQQRFCYYDGALYVMDYERGEDGGAALNPDPVLYRVNTDGSGKEELHRWKKAEIMGWMVHRGMVYYIQHQFSTPKDESANAMDEKYTVKKMEITKNGLGKPELIYQPEEGLFVSSMGWLQAYGNHVYFSIDATTTDDEEKLLGEDYMDYEYYKHWQYDIQSEELKELKSPVNTAEVTNLTFWKDRLILQLWDQKEYQSDHKMPVYIADLDGSNPEILFESMEQGKAFFSDGKYLYVSNCCLVNDKIEEKIYYDVYDENLKQVDTFAMPYSSVQDVTIGDEVGLYFTMMRKGTTGTTLAYFDKSKIGTCNKEAFPIEDIAYVEKTAADQIDEGGEDSDSED